METLLTLLNGSLLKVQLIIVDQSKVAENAARSLCSLSEKLATSKQRLVCIVSGV